MSTPRRITHLQTDIALPTLQVGDEAQEWARRMIAHDAEEERTGVASDPDLAITVADDVRRESRYPNASN